MTISLAAALRIALPAEILGGALLGAALLPPTVAGLPLRVFLALLAGALCPVLATAAMLALELAVDALTDPREPRGGWRNALRVCAGETAAALRAFCWRMPYRAGFADPPIARDPRRRAVLLVHGYLCNRAVWLPLLRSGALAGCHAATVDLTPIFGSIDRCVGPLREAVAALSAASGAPRVVLVCHSLGGLAARAYLAAGGDATVEQVITIATPHAGTIFARLGHSTNARQAIPGSAWLARLDAALTPALRRRFVCLASRDDNLVNPRASPLLPGCAATQLFDGVGHLALLSDRRVWATLRALLAAET